MNIEQIPDFARAHQLGKLARRDPADIGLPWPPDTTNQADLIAQEGDYDADTELVDDLADAEVILSVTGPPIPQPTADSPSGTWHHYLTNQPKHRPIIDVDFPVAVLPSSTPGHHHLYIDKELSWSDYHRLLEVLADVGIIERGYFDASNARQFTSVRLPWVRKADQ